MKNRLPRYLVFFLLVLTVQSVRADDHEREELSRLLHELNYLDKLLTVARQSARGVSSPRFDYLALDSDLARVKTGIADYLNQVRREPRVIEPITGDYTASGEHNLGD